MNIGERHFQISIITQAINIISLNEANIVIKVILLSKYRINTVASHNKLVLASSPAICMVIHFPKADFQKKECPQPFRGPLQRL